MAVRGDLPDLSAELRRRQRRRHRRPERRRARLPYLAELGVDAIWLSPFYPSPQADAGYDVSDYRDVDPVFGTLDDAKALITEAHDHGLRVIVDLVPNHTSDQHVWFQAALAAAPGSPERARYIFRDGPRPDGELPPNNWVSNFGGPAWTRVADGQWYLHLFTPEQPDLDWTNPEVVAEFQDILRFWMDLGVDGFRIDVAHGLAKDPDLADLPNGASGHLLTPAHSNDHPHWDRDEVHDVYRGWRPVIDEYGGDRVFFAEAWVPNPDRFAQYLRTGRAAHRVQLQLPRRALGCRGGARGDRPHPRRARDVGAPATWVLSNHDVTRHPTRFGGGELGLRRAKAATLLTLALPGGAYIYQGEELGLEEVLDIPGRAAPGPDLRPHRRRTSRPGRLPGAAAVGRLARHRSGSARAARRGCRSRRRGRRSTVEAQEGDPASTLTFYRAALRARRANPALGDGTDDLDRRTRGVLAFRRATTSSASSTTPTHPVTAASRPGHRPDHPVSAASQGPAHFRPRQRPGSGSNCRARAATERPACWTVNQTNETKLDVSLVNPQ